MYSTTFIVVLMQLRLSEVVLGMQEIFMGLADGDDILQASISPESFNRGLVKMGVRRQRGGIKEEG